MFEEEFVSDAEYSNRRRRKRLVCECQEVGGAMDRDCGCGGRREDVGGERDHHHGNHHHCGCGCGNVGGVTRNPKCKGCNCEKLRNLIPGDLVLISVVDSLSLLVPLEFARFDEATCCANFRLALPQPIGGIATISVDCRDIKVLVTI